MADQTLLKRPSSPRKRGSIDRVPSKAKTLDSRLRGNDEKKLASARLSTLELREHAFSDLYEMSSGISSTPKQAGHGAPFLSFSTVFNNYFLPEQLPDRMDTSEAEQRTYSVREGDVFLTRTSETVDELGMSSVALTGYPRATFSGFLKRLRPTAEGQTDPRFMAFYLRSPLFRRTMTNNAVMVLRASLNGQIFSYLKLLLPDFDTQTRIGEVLHLLHAKIALNNRINAELEVLAKMIYDYWFVQFDFPDAHGRPYKSSGGKTVWNDILKREIPVGWKGGTLSDIANITMGQSPAGDSYNEEGRGVVFFQGSTDFGNRSPNVRMYTTSPGRMAREGDILVSVRAPVGTLNIADRDCCIGRGLAALHSKDGSHGYLHRLMADFKQIFDRRSSEGTTFGSITKDDLFGLKVLIPDAHVLQVHARMANDWIRLAVLRDRESRELTRLRDWLLPLLMNGQVRVA